MGMDVCGLKPKSEAGEYFGASVWYWIPLWEYISLKCPDILTEREIRLGHANDGVRISAKKARAIGERLRMLLRSGGTTKYAAQQKRRKPNPRTEPVALRNARQVTKALGGKQQRAQFRVEAVKAFAEFCLASGGFEID